MAYQKIGHRGVLCLEGAWDDDLRDRSSVLPTLQMLESLGRTSFIHRDVGTRAEFFGYLKRVRPKTRYGHYEVLHLACHGERGRLDLGNREFVELPELAEAIKEITDRRPIEAVYFGSCLVMSTKAAELREFHRVSGVRHVIGHRKEVDWIESAGFELMALEALTGFSRVGDGINYLQRGALGSFAKSLGFDRLPSTSARTS